ncbi:MAG: glycosyl transferase [Bacilli bacterium]|nr:glycosyl transferase [Bacilli bacterium]
MKKILIVTDAWAPHINGVVFTIQNTIKVLTARGFEVSVLEPSMFNFFTLPVYKDIPISYNHKKKLYAMIDAINPDYIHISTEGIIGITSRRYCIEKNLKFTTAYHTKFPEYVKENLGIPLAIGYLFMKWFHRKSAKVLVTTEAIKKELRKKGIFRTVIWSRGVDTELFSPLKASGDSPYPYVLYVGRVAVEKNLTAFLDLDLSPIDPKLKKVIVGNGVEFSDLSEKYKDAIFVGAKSGEELSTYYANAEVFCFPSKTDTFGLVLIEALSSGVPVAAFPVPQIKDIINEKVGCLNESLLESIKFALENKNSEACRQYVIDHYTWEIATDLFLKNMVLAK